MTLPHSIWGLEELHSTDKTLILISVIFILLAYNVFRVFYDGKNIGRKARQRIKQERIKAKKEAWVTIYHEDKFGLFPLQEYTFEILDRPPDIKEKLKKRMEELMDDTRRDYGLTVQNEGGVVNRGSWEPVLE